MCISWSAVLTLSQCFSGHFRLLIICESAITLYRTVKSGFISQEVVSVLYFIYFLCQLFRGPVVWLFSAGVRCTWMNDELSASCVSVAGRRVNYLSWSRRRGKGEGICRTVCKPVSCCSPRYNTSFHESLRFTRSAEDQVLMLSHVTNCYSICKIVNYLTSYLIS